MDYKYLHRIDSPADLKKLSRDVLPIVCAELRNFIIDELSHNPGHLASSLGTIELTVALHYVFDTPNDKLVWDVGHQAYAHKILTGRRNRFSTNRQYQGLAPFPTPKESEYDAFVAGHASNSISAALGIEIGEELQHRHHNVVAIIGDGALTGGLAFEGLNNTSMDKNNLLIILNDNNMAIDPISGGITQYLVDITTSSLYNRWRWHIYQWLLKCHLINAEKANRLRRFSNHLKTGLTYQKNNIFQGLNLRYFGPADGHNVIDLVRILTEIKNHKGPKVLHIITKKGKGYEPAENNQTVWHAPGEFQVETGERLCTTNSTTPLWQEIFGETLLDLAKQNDKIVGVTPAMPSGCSMCIMQKEFPDRVFDVGIAEGHAVTFSAGMAKENLIPYCNIYSSFLQRAYDNIIHDVAILNLHVIFCIDRAGLVGNDGATHHGLFDIAYLRLIPHMQISAPRTAQDLEAVLRLAEHMEGPVAIRYPRGRAMMDTNPIPFAVGKAVQLHTGTDLAVLTIGSIGNAMAQAISMVEQQTNATIAHIDMRWVKPIDTDMLDYIGTHYSKIVTAEDGIIQGGFGSAILEYMADKHYAVQVVRLGIDNQFVEHGSTQELYHILHLDEKGLCESLLQVLAK